MKKFVFFASAIVAMACATSCSNDDDVVLVSEGNINLTGQYVTYMHGNQGWTAEDVVGVFVASKDALQSNLKYTPSEVCPLVPNKWVPEIITYDQDNPVDGQVILNTTTPAEFYGGTHAVYAYTPFQEGKIDYKAVALPAQNVQEYGIVNAFYGPLKKYCFAYANTSLAAYTSAPQALEFKTPFRQLTATSPDMADSFGGKTVTKIVLSAPIDIAVENATINLSTGKIEGKMSKSVELKLPAEGLTIKEGMNFGSFSLPPSMETTYYSLTVDYETAMNTEFTFTYTIDGKEYIAKGKPNQTMSSEENLNMYNSLSFE